MDGSWDAHLASTAGVFAGADDNTKERESGSLIITSLEILFHFHFTSRQLTLIEIYTV